MHKSPEPDIPSRTEDVLRALGMWRLPVDPVQICKQEDIELAPGRYGDNFDGRIRYLREVDVFALAYQQPSAGRTIGRVNFTIGHELGHYYLHRDYLFSGHSHGSQADFRSRDTMEQEADEFSAALLMPLELFRAAVRDYRRHVCILRELCELAETRLRTSVTSTVRRYCQADIEPCAAIFCRSGIVQWACYSEEMRELGMGFVPFGKPIPRGCITSRLISNTPPTNLVDGQVQPTKWFERSYHRGALWEEAMLLGDTGLSLTYLTLAD